MPFYEYHCNECGQTFDAFRKMEQRAIPEYHCAKEATRIISRATIRGEIEPYISPASGRLISSRYQRDEDLRREGAILNEPGLKQDIERRAVELREKTFEPIDKTIDDTVSAMHAANLI
jgi:putative FmdB family regulatory protein